MQKLLIVVLATSTAVFAIWTGILTKQVRTTNERVRAAQEERAAETEVRELQSARVKELERNNAQLEAQVQKFTAVTTSLRTNEALQSSNMTAMAARMKALQGGNGAAGDGDMGKGMGDMLGKMMKDPTMREMIREQQKAMVGMMYSGLFKDLKLNPEDSDKLKKLLTDLQMRAVDQAKGMFGDKDNTADATKQFEEAKKQTDAEIKALLGDDGYAKFEDYRKTMSERMQLDQLDKKLASENMPLQEQQRAQIMQIMKEEKAAVPPILPTDNSQMPSKDTFTAENVDKQLQWMDDYNTRVENRLAGLLTPEQMKQYHDFAEQQKSMQKLAMNMAKQMFGGKGAAPAK